MSANDMFDFIISEQMVSFSSSTLGFARAYKKSSDFWSQSKREREREETLIKFIETQFKVEKAIKIREIKNSFIN